MARFEQDREDLLNEAIGYSNRVLFRVVPSNKELFIGRRGVRATSFYLGDRHRLPVQFRWST